MSKRGTKRFCEVCIIKHYFVEDFVEESKRRITGNKKPELAILRRKERKK